MHSLQAAERGGLAFVVEAQPVDDGIILGEAKHPGFGVSGLWARSQGAHLNKAKAAPQHGMGHLRIFVEAGCKPHGVRKFYACNG